MGNIRFINDRGGPFSASPRSGQTLLELIAASALLALAIVPALRLLRGALEQTDRCEGLEASTNYCVSKLEEHLAQAGGQWTEVVSAGTFATEGRPALRYQVVRSDDSSAGGIPDRLMAVTATVWDDQDGDALQDTGEPSAQLSSKVSKMANLIDVANGP